MRAQDLDLRELLDFEPDGGIIRFAGDRTLLLNTVAFGLLRQEMVETLGVLPARGILTRFGFTHGWRTAEMLKTAYHWDSEEEWHLAGGRLHQLQGFVVAECRETTMPGDGDEPPLIAHGVWRDSYEAQTHLQQFGPSTEPVCWTCVGFASGYLSYCFGRRIYCVEERCRAKGDAFCLVKGRFAEDWDEAVHPQLVYYEKDCLDGALKHMTASVKRAEKRLAARRRALAHLRVDEPHHGIVAASPKMRRVLGLAQRAARVDSTVLLTGESGVGKEVVARLIHDESARAPRPFIAINVAAVPDALLESELFGHVRGAFTGATQDRVGLFEAANGGTLLLDEIGDLPLAMQVKLLRVLQEREFRRVGENRTRRADVRVLAATHQHLPSLIADGRFRQDLYYRLQVIEIPIPPLRERREDLLALARQTLADAASRMKLTVTGFTPHAADLLLRWPWPGNVRELQNVVERAAVMAQASRIDAEDLPDEIRLSTRRGRNGAAGASRTLADVERDHILGVLESVDGNRTKAAAALGIGAATLFRKLKDYQ